MVEYTTHFAVYIHLLWELWINLLRFKGLKKGFIYCFSIAV